MAAKGGLAEPELSRRRESEPSAITAAKLRHSDQSGLLFIFEY